MKKGMHRTEVETEPSGIKACVVCRTSAVRRGFYFYCNCEPEKVSEDA